MHGLLVEGQLVLLKKLKKKTSLKMFNILLKGVPL